jgi:prepilin-type N-terminal cleavage/methylation domain-containing protein
MSTKAFKRRSAGLRTRHLSDWRSGMRSNPDRNTQAGFSLIELMVAMTVFLIIAGGAFALLSNAVRVSSTTFEMTDAQESLRFAQEYINRDLIIAGDGLEEVTGIRLPTGFVTNYLTADQISPSGGFVNIEMMSPDNDVAASFLTPLNPPGAAGTGLTVLAGTDRISMIARDPSFEAVAVQGNTGTPVKNSPTMAVATPSTGPRITINFQNAGEMNRFQINEIYYFSSSDSKRRTFAAVTGKNNGGGNNVTFATGDPYGLNPSTTANAPVQWISMDGATMTGFTISRMQIITYFVQAKTTGNVTSGLLTKRVIGVPGRGYTDSVIAEHVTGLQFRYQLNMRDTNGEMVAPVSQFSAASEMITVRQVEVTLTAESTHRINNNVRPTITSTTATSIRNLQFNGAL